MNYKPEIAIIEPNTLCSLGLKSILEEIIPMATIRTFHNFNELMDDTPDMYAHYFISAQIYVEHNAFFLPRKRKTIVLASDSPQFQLSGVPVLNIYESEEKLVKNILADEQKEMAAKLEPIDFEIKENEGKKTEIDELNKGKKEDEIPQVDKDRKKEYDDKINGLRKQKQELLQEYGKGNQVVGQLIDLALLANGLLKGEALNKFVKRSVELIK